jgi:hypothetical protein
MVALDTVLVDVHNASGAAIGLTAGTAANGDSLTIRNFPDSSWARLEAVSLMAGTAGRQVQVKSPAFHDNVTGLTWKTTESPAEFLLPREVGQPLTRGDTLSVLMDAAATSDSVCTLHNYYAQGAGSDGRYYSWGDISSIIKTIKPVQVAITTSATIGQWTDTVITTTDNQLHADTDYAVLGYYTDVSLVAIGIKGQDTGNLRACGPGMIGSLDPTDYFVQMSQLHGTPHIPVINSNNKASIYLSAAANTASVAATPTLILAELSQTLG